MSYGSVWMIVIAAGVLATGGVYMLIRPLSSGYLRALICGLTLALLVTPAPVPEYPPHYAPAFIVAIFEGILQAEGSAGVALRLLLLGITTAVAIVTLAAVGLHRWRARTAPESGP